MSELRDSGILRLGLIGAGPWGRNYIHTIAGLDGVQLARLASSNPDSTGLIEPGCTISRNWSELVNAGDLDGIIIASPPDTHAEITLTAINNNLPTLVEKPMTLSVTEAETVLATAQAEDAIVMVDHIHLYSAAWEAVKRQAQDLGAIRAISGVAGNWGPFRQDTSMLWDWGSHDVAMCIDLMGRMPEQVTAACVDARDGGETLALTLDFGDTKAHLSVGNLYSEKNRLFTISFEKGELIYDDTLEGGDKVRLKTSPRDPGGTFKLDPGTPLERAVIAFCDAIRRGAPEWDDAALGAQVVGTLARLDSTLA
ncbi:MAG: Gfo/Idh/MocA family oxidoreductase [Alphaproteobacteria bacterium]|nr:Gfo/Idh/MocA family oxidoreductase [Alphaproteobacteria bacterium]MBT7943080.1 Gfo/Idh/MocA family oxidoreductase [Alphaproteobacteria bacterium]